MLPVYIASFVIALYPEPKRTILLHKTFKLWMGIFMPFVFCPVRSKGEENFYLNTSCIVVCNHNSFMDIPVSSPWIPGANKTLAKIEISKIPLFGRIYKLGSILVDRGNAASRKESFTIMRQTLQQGMHLCLYPEGTRNKTDQALQPFQDGAFVIAIREQKPIIPALIFNTKNILPNRHQPYACPSPIEIHFLKPISTKGFGINDVSILKEKTWNIMNQYYLNNYNNL